MTRFLFSHPRTGLSLSAVLTLLPAAGVPVQAQAPETYNACFVPTVGAIYLIKRTGLLSACVAPAHVEITWTAGAVLADGSVTAVKVADGAIITIKLADGAVTAAKLAAGAVGTVQIADGAVTSAKLGSDVGATILGDGSVTTAKLADGAVTTAKMADGSVTTGKLADGAVTGAKVDFAGPGAATTVARSDHTHAVAGTDNTAVGASALNANTTGDFNTTVGANGLGNNTAGRYNTAIGASALAANTTGSTNTAVGGGALATNQIGVGNTAVGTGALTLNTARYNTAVGTWALNVSTSGSSNIALGYDAGREVTTGSSNIHIGNMGTSLDNATIKIGYTQTKTFIAGISGVTTGGTGVAVLVDGAGQLGTVSSSRRYKDDIHDMGEASRRLLDLRPVVFRYKRPASDGSRPLEYGLIAEEVAEVFPELVVYDSTGQAETVRYHVLPVLLLNEVQRQERQLAALRQTVDSLRTILAERSSPKPAVQGRRSGVR